MRDKGRKAFDFKRFYHNVKGKNHFKNYFIKYIFCSFVNCV